MSMARMRAQAEEAEKALELGDEEEQKQETQEEETQEVETQEVETQQEEESQEEKVDPETEQLKAQLATLQHRLDTVQGMLKASNAEKKALQEQSEKKAVESTKPAPLNLEETEHFLALKEEFGEKTARSMVALTQAETSALRKENEELRAILDKTGAQTETLAKGYQATAEDRFYEVLGTRHGDWENFNGNPDAGIPQDPRFTKFLLSSAPGTGMTYDDLLGQASSVLDAKRAAEVFDIFKAQHKIEPKKTVKGKEAFVDVGITGHGAKPPEGKQKEKIYTQAEVDRLWRSMTNNTFKGTRAERQALEEELTSAELSGRVR